MLLRHRPVYLLRTVAIFLAIFAAVNYWRPSNGARKRIWAATSAVDDRLATLNPGLGDVNNRQHPVGLESSGIKNQGIIPNHAAPAKAVEQGIPGSQTPMGAGTIDTSPLPLPIDYELMPASTSDFCLNRFTTKWFDLMHAGHNQYCLASAASRLHCFHTPTTLRNDGHIDSLCVVQNAVFDPHMNRFTLDCPLTIRVPQGMPKTPIDMHQYWYETGPRAILLNYIAIDDRAEIVQHHKVKAPVSKGSWQKRDESTPHSIGPPALITKSGPSLSQRAVSAETTGPRTFTLLLKRESAHNIFHILHELMSLQLTFDTLGSYRDPATNAPFYVPEEDFDNTQFVITDTHSDGPLFELLSMFTGRKPKRLIQLAHKAAAEAADTAGQEDYTSWLKSGSLDNVIIPLAGGANSVWHDNWEKWDCRYELRQVFVKRVLEFYGFKSNDGMKKNSGTGRAFERRDVALGSENEPSANKGDRTPGSPAVAAGAIGRAKGSGGTAELEIPSSSTSKSQTEKPVKSEGESRAEAGASGSSRVLKEGLEAHMEQVFDKQPSTWDDGPSLQEDGTIEEGSMSSTGKVELEPSKSEGTQVRDKGKLTEKAADQPLVKDEDAPEQKSTGNKSASSQGKQVEQEKTAAKDKSESSESSKEAEKATKEEPKKEDDPVNDKEEKKDANPKKEEEDAKPKEPEGPSPYDGSSSSSPSPPTLEAADIPPPPANAIVITFIDRKDTRRISKHEELIAHARSSLASSRPIHVQSLDLAQYPFRDQIAIARSTDILVGVHGAGLTHTMFMRQGVGALVEIFPEGLALRCFQAMAKDREMGYFKMVVPVVEKKEDWHEVDVVVDRHELVGVLKEAVKTME